MGNKQGGRPNLDPYTTVKPGNKARPTTKYISKSSKSANVNFPKGK